MSNQFVNRAGTFVVAICLILLPVMQTASAAIIQTDTAIEITERQQQIDRINEVLARDNVRGVLIGLGVDADDASARVQSLTATELQTLEQQLDELPAGGVGFVEIVGVVAIVLVILELLNITNFFSEF
jgi:RNase H-fold protein (predicted Holliday junction resolvase)